MSVGYVFAESSLRADTVTLKSHVLSANYHQEVHKVIHEIKEKTQKSVNMWITAGKVSDCSIDCKYDFYTNSLYYKVIQYTEFCSPVLLLLYVL